MRLNLDWGQRQYLHALFDFTGETANFSIGVGKGLFEEGLGVREGRHNGKVEYVDREEVI